MDSILISDYKYYAYWEEGVASLNTFYFWLSYPVSWGVGGAAMPLNLHHIFKLTEHKSNILVHVYTKFILDSPVLSELILTTTETKWLLCCMQLPVVAQCCQN